MIYTTTQIYDDMLETFEWFKSLKIRNIENSRLPDVLKYLKFYTEQFPKFQNGEPNNLLEYVNDAGTALNEATALNRIRIAFSKLNKNHLPRKKLKECITGSFHSYDEKHEDNTHQARNTMFELETAANLIMNGYNVTGFEDINLLIDKDDLSIQCKRPMSWGQLNDNFNFSVSQLITKNNILEGANSFGMIAISLEKLYNLDTAISNAPEPTIESEKGKLNIIRYVKDKNELDKMIKDTIIDINKKITPLWNAIIKEEPRVKLVGMIYLYRIAVYYEDIKEFSYKREFIYSSPLYSDESPLKRITDYFDRKKVVKE